MKEKLERFKSKGKESSTQKLKNVSQGWGQSGIKIKFKIKSIEEENGKSVVTIDVLDVLRREGNKGVETPDNYLRGEINDVTKESVESTIIADLGHKFREFIGQRMKWKDGTPQSNDVEFKFNHLRDK